MDSPRLHGVSRGSVLWELFERGLSSHPAAIALRLGGVELTYGELAERARQLAGSIRSSCRSAPSTIGLVLPKSVELYVAYLAAAVLNATVVPFDGSAPNKRTVTCAQRAAVELVICSRSTLGAFESSSRMGIGLLDGSRFSLWRDLEPVERAAPSDCAYVMFTSGTTGEPKGVPISSSNVRAYFSHIGEAYTCGPENRHSQLFAVSFDLSVHDLFLTWSAGAALCVPTGRDANLLSSYVEANGITHLFTVPSALDLAARIGSLDAGSLDELEVFAFCGEPLTMRQMALARRAAPNARVLNLYGPTENTISCTVFEVPNEPAALVDPGNGTVPIGAPFGANRAALASELGLADGVDPDELLLGGAQTFGGYLGPADVSDRAFLDGRHRDAEPDRWYRTGDRASRGAQGLVHRGRLDDQLKLRGFRVEPAEIESALEQHPGVDAAVVSTVAATEHGDVLAVLYSGRPCSPQDLRRFLATMLPPYMIPLEYYLADDLPINANGKRSRSEAHRLVGERRRSSS